VNELKKMKPESGRSGPPPRRTKEKNRHATRKQPETPDNATPCATRLRIKQNEIFSKNLLPLLLD